VGSASGLFVMVYSLPIIIVGWFLGNITKTFGKKRTGFVSFIIGALIFSFIYRVSNTWEILAITFIASIFISLSWPAISGAMADYIDEKRGWESEIEGMGDLYANLGYVIGPMLAGFMSDKIGTSLAFSSMAIILAALTLILMNLTPRKIKL
jgi:MFS family permease